ncbi:MAG: PocR ligand-binding domain-containing protein [Lachnospiraceae bacterium]|nr:PocR ligand-binding domain-containing protein [Lachnospiraceae bacterium]
MFLDININKLTKLVKSFYELTKIRMVIYDDAFNEIFSYPVKHTVFCDMMNQNPQIHQKCTASASHACDQCRRQNRLIVYTCHAGLTEVVAPLYENNTTIGYIMFGQITNIKNRPEFAKKARLKCENYPLDFEEFAKKIKTVPYKTNSQLEAISEIMNVFTTYISLQKIVSTKQEETLESILDYIDKNLHSDLSVQSICEKFSISKTVLYDLTQSAMPGGIAKYIRLKRIEKAKELLFTTDKPVEEISGLSGFMDCNYFRRVFKQATGLSAKSYRKKSRSH